MPTTPESLPALPIGIVRDVDISSDERSVTVNITLDDSTDIQYSLRRSKGPFGSDELVSVMYRDQILFANDRDRLIFLFLCLNPVSAVEQIEAFLDPDRISEGSRQMKSVLQELYGIEKADIEGLIETVVFVTDNLRNGPIYGKLILMTNQAIYSAISPIRDIMSAYNIAIMTVNPTPLITQFSFQTDRPVFFLSRINGNLELTDFDLTSGIEFIESTLENHIRELLSKFQSLHSNQIDLQGVIDLATPLLSHVKVTRRNWYVKTLSIEAFDYFIILISAYFQHSDLSIPNTDILSVVNPSYSMSLSKLRNELREFLSITYPEMKVVGRVNSRLLFK